jgi:vitamin B12 transporter
MRGPASSVTTGSSLEEDEMIDAVPNTEITVTAERAPEQAEDTPATVTIIDEQRIERLGDALVASLLRLTPSVAVATSGTAGSLTEVRIRGAENNHTLLFIDGIRANDPATGNQPRYELLNADLASHIEVVRGPQSALWGSEAVGGVIAVNGVESAGTHIDGTLEAGSFGFVRSAASTSYGSGPVNAAAAVGFQRATGIDAFDGSAPGDKDGYRNLSGRFRATWAASPALEIGVTGFALTGRNDYDGFNPAPPFQHMDTLDSGRNKLVAGRLWAAFGQQDAAWSGHLGGSLLGSRNRNLLNDSEINRTSGERSTLEAQAEHRFRTGNINHRLILALDHEREEFHARGSVATEQDRDRSHHAATAEWRSDAGALAADVSVRRDWFNRFDDATTVRASFLARLGAGFSLAASYGEGIAQPTFFDLYGFFPGSFEGNQLLKPERSRGFEVSLRFSRGSFEGSITGYRQRLADEIVDTFDPSTFVSSTVNSSDESRRSGVELETDWRLGEKLRLSANYAYLHAIQPDDLGLGMGRLKEARRPKHSGSVAADGQAGRITYGLSLAYSGTHFDTDFEAFPFRRVELGAYWLAGARVAYSVSPGLEIFARAANAFDEHYQDALGYSPEGRSVYAGMRLAPRL